jgi:hypothetical protein
VGNGNDNEGLLPALLHQYRVNLNTIAMFFLKRHFQHVSILEGGFVRAGEYVLEHYRTDDTISSMFTDVNTQLLARISKNRYDLFSSRSLQTFNVL